MNFRWHHLSKDIEFRQGRIKGDQVSHKFHEILGIFMHFLHAPPAPKYPTDIDVMDHSRRVSPQDVDPARWGNNGLDTSDLRNQQWMKGNFRQAKIAPVSPEIFGSKTEFPVHFPSTRLALFSVAFFWNSMQVRSGQSCSSGFLCHLIS